MLSLPWYGFPRWAVEIIILTLLPRLPVDSMEKKGGALWGNPCKSRSLGVLAVEATWIAELRSLLFRHFTLTTVAVEKQQRAVHVPPFESSPPTNRWLPRLPRSSLPNRHQLQEGFRRLRPTPRTTRDLRPRLTEHGGELPVQQRQVRSSMRLGFSAWVVPYLTFLRGGEKNKYARRCREHSGLELRLSQLLPVTRS